MKAVLTKLWQGAVILVGSLAVLALFVSGMGLLIHDSPWFGVPLAVAEAVGLCYLLGDKVAPLL